MNSQFLSRSRPVAKTITNSVSIDQSLNLFCKRHKIHQTDGDSKAQSNVTDYHTNPAYGRHRRPMMISLPARPNLDNPNLPRMNWRNWMCVPSTSDSDDSGIELEEIYEKNASKVSEKHQQMSVRKSWPFENIDSINHYRVQTTHQQDRSRASINCQSSIKSSINSTKTEKRPKKMSIEAAVDVRHTSRQSKRGFTTAAGSNSTPSSLHRVSSTTSDSSMTSLMTSSSASKHNLNDGYEGDECSEEEKRAKRPKAATQIQGPIPGRLLACPYAKFDASRYSWENTTELTYRRCSISCLRNIPRLKQHLHRVHKRPEHYCSRCFETFKSKVLLQYHERQRLCSLNDCPFEEKMTEDQLKAIRRRSPRMNAEACWYNIYQILFPDAARPESPYAENPSFQIGQFEGDFLQQQIPRRIVQIINTTMQHHMPNVDLSHMLDAQFEEAIDSIIINARLEFQQSATAHDVESLVSEDGHTSGLMIDDNNEESSDSFMSDNIHYRRPVPTRTHTQETSNSVATIRANHHEITMVDPTVQHATRTSHIDNQIQHNSYLHQEMLAFHDSLLSPMSNSRTFNEQYFDMNRRHNSKMGTNDYFSSSHTDEHHFVFQQPELHLNIETWNQDQPMENQYSQH